MIRIVLLSLVALALLAPDARAQRRGAFGIGGQIGEPTGVTLKAGVGRGAVDFAAGWDLSEGNFFAQGHYLLREQRLPGSEAGVFFGPGVFVASVSDNAAFGLSFNAGLNYYTGPLEIFGQLTPRLQLVDNTDFGFGGALGLRYYP